MRSEVPVDALAPGMIVRVNGGRQVPADLRVTRRARVPVTNPTSPGRPVPLPKALGDDLLAGHAQSERLCSKAACCVPAQESALQKVIHLIEKAQTLRAPAQRFTDKFGTDVHLRHPWPLRGDVRRLAVRVRPPGLPLDPRPPQRVLPGDDPPGRGLALRAGPEYPVGHPLGHRVRARGAASSSGVARRWKPWPRSTSSPSTRPARSPPGICNCFRSKCLRARNPPSARMAYNLARFSDHPLSRAIKRLGQEDASTSCKTPNTFETLPGQGLRADFGGRCAYALGRRELVGTEFFPCGRLRTRSNQPPRTPQRSTSAGPAWRVG